MPDKYNTRDQKTPLLTTKEAAKLLGVTPRFLEAARLKGTGPTFMRLSRRCIRYDLADLILWQNQQKVSHTTQATC